MSAAPEDRYNRISNKPIFWSLFAAGGSVTAFLGPALVLAAGLGLGIGLIPEEAMRYERIAGFVAHPLGALVMLGVTVLTIWYAGHRMRIMFHDLGLTPNSGFKTLIMLICYVGALLLSLSALVSIIRVMSSGS